jgi:predicted DsbA family dithiol-disulfide isomerase
VAKFSEEFDVDVAWWPFELHPETPVEGRDVTPLLERRGRAGEEYRSHLKACAAEAGITLASNRWLANSHRALELAEFARDRGKFGHVHDALFRAYFEEAKNIGDEAVLDDLVREAGLDLDEWRTESAMGRYRELVDYTTSLARQKGFTATPTMIFDGRMVVSGAQEEALYRDVLTRLGAPRRAE